MTKISNAFRNISRHSFQKIETVHSGLLDPKIIERKRIQNNGSRARIKRSVGRTQSKYFSFNAELNLFRFNQNND